MLVGKSLDPDKLVHKLEKRVGDYFGSEYQLHDFTLSKAVFTVDIDVRSRENVAAYLKVLKRVGKVKNFMPSEYEWLDGVPNFCLEGRSNSIDFLIYDLNGLCMNRLRSNYADREELKALTEQSKGILRVEVRLTKPKAIRAYSVALDSSGQIEELAEKGKSVFMDVFTGIVPFGEFRKKADTMDAVRKQVQDDTLRRKMLYLIKLIPEKKSLWLAQKALNYRKLDEVMNEFAALDLSPTTLSKRHNVKRLENLYKYLGN